MLIQQKSGNLAEFKIGNRTVDILPLEWFEANKRILHKRTQVGREVILKFLNESQHLGQDDVLFQDENYLIVVDILPCEAIVIKPATMYQMAAVCYEIGNKHLPLFFVNEELLIPYEAPIFRLLQAAGYRPVQEKRKLTNQMKTTISPHNHSKSSSESIFSKIMQLTSASNA